MFKIESFITPYILAYLDKYIKNFNPDDFQVSLWGGGAAFTNLNLNLEVLDQEFNLPVSFVSGHIHELRITVPWTKLTYEPIVINVNTIEISLKLKSLCKDQPQNEPAKQCVTKDVLVVSKDPNVPTSYVQTLLNKLFTNIKFKFENVIVKYVEEDIVLSLNIMKASMFTVDSNWKGAFVDLIAPDFALRKIVEVSDLTVCLDKCNSAGKIDAYQEPLLYKCSFNVRILQKYRSPQSKRAYFSRTDVLVDKMEFSVTNEQVPMLMRLYNLMVSLSRVNLNSVSLHHPKWISPQSIIDKPVQAPVFAVDSGEQGAVLPPELENEGGMMTWASWALNSVSNVMFGEYDEEEESMAVEEPENANFLAHIAFFVNKATFTFKAFERVYDKNSYDRKTIKVRFLPFLKWTLQGLMCESICQLNEIAYHLSACKMGVEGIGFCPCGIVDCTDNEKEQNPKIRDRNIYLKIGMEDENYMQGSMFENELRKLSETGIPADDVDESTSSAESKWCLDDKKELMKDGKHAFAMEYTMTIKEPKFTKTSDDSDDSDNSAVTDIDMSSDELRLRVIFGPLYLVINSGLIHRLKMIQFAIKVYNYEPYDHVHNCFTPKPVPQHELDFKYLHNFHSAFDVYELTFIKPFVEIFAADHPEYDSQSRLRHTLRRRRMTTTTPLSFVVHNWPKVLLTGDVLHMSMNDPSIKFKAVVQRSNKNTPRLVLSKFKKTSEYKINGCAVDLIVGRQQMNICNEFSCTYHQEDILKPELTQSLKHSLKWGLDSDLFNMQLTFPQAMVLKIIYLSYLKETLSEHLTVSTILEDQSLNVPVLNMRIERLQYLNVISLATEAKKFLIGNISISISKSNVQKPVVVLEGCPPPDASMIVVLFQFPYAINDELAEGSAKFEDESTTPIFFADISEFKMQYNECVLEFLQYKSKQQQTTVPLAVRMSKEIMAPMTPLSRSETGSKTSLGKDLYRSSSMESTSLSGTDLQALFKSKTSSRVTESHGSSFNYIQEKPHESNHSYLEMEESIDESDKKDLELTQTFEQWIVDYLTVIKKTLTIINVGGGELWFPLKDQPIYNFQGEPNNIAGVMLSLAKVNIHPRAIKQWLPIGEQKLPFSVPAELKGRDLYPQLISMENMYFAVSSPEWGKRMCSDPLSTVATFSLTQKLAEGKSPIIAAYLHCDIPSYKLSFTYLQITIVRQLLQQMIYSMLKFTKDNGSLGSLPTLSTQNITFDFQENNSCSVSEASAFIESAASQSKQQNLTSSLKRNSTTPSPPLAKNSQSDEDSLPPTGKGAVAVDVNETKATLWLQTTLAQFKLIVYGTDYDENLDTGHKLVFEINDILSSLDFQSVFVKWNLKIANSSLRSYERKSGGKWDFDHCLGVIMSSCDDITRAIHVAECPKTFNNNIISTSGSSSPVPLTSSSGVSKIRGILMLTFTSVLCSNFHKKADVPSPVSRWISTVEKYHDKNYDEYVPIEKEEERCLHEIDIILRSVDFVICPSVFKPYGKILNEILEFHIPSDILVTGEADKCVIPYLNNNSMPLVYMETEALRVFLKTETKYDKSTKLPDVAVLQLSSVNLQSQSENILHRTKIRPHVYTMAERARILSIPGSPVEDRQYQVDFHGVSISTCQWKDVEACSRRTFTKRPSAILKTQGENPALDWNNMLGEVSLDEVEAQPLLDRLEICCNFAPAIVYERCPGVPCKSLVVAGYSAECNFTNDIALYLNLNQLEFVKKFLVDVDHLVSQSSIRNVEQCLEINNVTNNKSVTIDVEPNCSSLLHDTTRQLQMEDNTDNVQTIFLKSPSKQNYTPFPEDQLESLVHSNDPKFEKGKSVKIPSNVSEEGDEVSTSVTGKFPALISGLIQQFSKELSHRHSKDNVPFDVLITGSALRVTIYDIKYINSSKLSITPIGYTFVGQPHLTVSTALCKQRAEASVFDLSLNLASPTKKIVKSFRVPDSNEFNLKIFESILGERNPKTGMVAPLINAKINEIHEQRFRVLLEITRPLSVVINQGRIENVSRFLKVCKSATSRSTELPLLNENTTVQENTLRKIMTRVEKCSLNLSQVVICIVEEPTRLPRASITFSCSCTQFNVMGSGVHRKLSKQEMALKASGNAHLALLTVSTSIGDRMDVLVNPVNLNIEGKCRWKEWSEDPYCIITGEMDPVVINFGTNNILAVLQVYQGLKQYLSSVDSSVDVIESGSSQEVIGNDNPHTAFTVDVFKDDLRAGAFHYKQTSSCEELPSVYEIIFCESQRVMTWRYPQPRALIRIEASQVPLDPSQFSNLKEQRLQCVVEYWDECCRAFRFYGVLYVSEQEKGQVIIPSKDKLHAYISTIWRIKITTRLEDADGENLVKPEMLAACLKVDSIYEPAFLAKLRANFATPRVCINLMNHLYYSGKAGDERLRQYTMGGLTFYDHPFSTVEISMNSLMLGSWINQSSINYSGFLKVDVVDYAYLTNISFVEPIKIKCNALFHAIPKSNKVNSEMNLFIKPIVIKLGVSAAHTLMSSLVTWTQVLENYDGEKVDFKNFEYSKNIILSRTVVCNDIAYDIALKSAHSEKQTIIRSRECFGLVFPSDPPNLKYNLGLRDVEWKWSNLFNCCTLGSTSLIMPNKKPVFVNVTQFSSSHRLVTISGCFTVGNIIDQSLEIALFSRHNSKESKWIVQSRGYGPSQMTDIKDIEHLRFRFLCLVGGSNPWSGIVTVNDLKESPNGSVGLQLYKEESGKLQTYNVWCTLIEECQGDAHRYLIVVCPFFRMRSCVSFDTIAHISTSKKETETSFVLPGKCIDMQVEFIGDFDAAHHLTFQTHPHLQSSTPSIPLLPGGPAFKTPHVVRPIDDVLNKILGLKPLIVDRNDEKEELKWPYISDEIPFQEWFAGSHNEKEINVVVGSEPWIEGLPTILLEARPWGLFVNISGSEVLICDTNNDKISAVPSHSVFSPKKIESHFKLGIQLPAGTFWSLPLEFTEQKSRTDIHHVNINSKIPLDCFSRLEIHCLSEMMYLTLEAKVYKGIIILVMRPTFSIKNECKYSLMVHGVSLVNSETQNPKDWACISNYFTLKSTSNNPRRIIKSVPLLMFSRNCDEYVVGKSGLKYLALSCGGPWWFVQLMKFELIFDNMSANIGFPAKRMAIALPKFGRVTGEMQDKKLQVATLPLVMTWMSKNGQVWISLSPDPSPQVTINNLTGVDLLYARASQEANIPCEDTEHFDQHLLLPKNTQGHYTFQSSNSKFPDLNAGVREILPSLVIAQVDWNSLPVRKGTNELSNIQQESKTLPVSGSDCGYDENKGNLGTLVFNEFRLWSKDIKIDGDNITQQYFRLFNSVDVKIHVERLGQSYFVYIENTSSIEVSAKDIRGRILKNATENLNSLLHPPDSEDTSQSPVRILMNSDVALRTSFSEDVKNGYIQNSSEEDFNINSKRSILTAVEEKISEITHRSWEFRAFSPEMRLIITDDVSNPAQKSELLSVTLQDILLEQKTFSDKTVLRTLNNQTKEISVVNLLIGDFQIDIPSHGDKKCDFSVMLKQETEYNMLPNFDNNPSVDFLPYFLTAQRAEGCFMIQGNFIVTEKKLEEIHLKILPFSAYMEDHFLDNVYPSFYNIYEVITENAQLMSSPKDSSHVTPQIIKNTSVKKHSNILLLDTKEVKLHSRITFNTNRTTNTTSPLSPLTILTHSDFNISTSDIHTPSESSHAESFYTSVNDMDTLKDILYIKSHRAALSGKSTFNTPKINFKEKSPQSELLVEEGLSTEKDDSGSQDKNLSGAGKKESAEDNDFLDEPSWLSVHSVSVPPEVVTVLHQFSHPLWLKKLSIEPCEVFVTFRMFRKMYFAVDHSPMHMDGLHIYSLQTTSYGLGQAMATHYFNGAVFQVKNPLRLIGSMELLGSPGSLARSVGTGLRDFVVYPYQGLFQGPSGFISGLTHGFSSLVRNVTAGTLTSVTNWAWSVSRNIDKFTLDKDEQIFSEEGRRVEVEGFTDGLIQGFTGFGIRLLGAVGGIAHHPIQNVIERGASPSSVISGVGKGILGVVTKPIGGAVELVAMTGQGLLRGAGWTPKLKMKHEPYVEHLDNCSSSLLKLRWRLFQEMEGYDDRLILVVDATRLTGAGKSSQMTFVSLVLTTQNLYLINLNNDGNELVSWPITKLDVVSNDNVVTIKPAHSKKMDEVSLAEERIMEFVRGYSKASSLPVSPFPKCEASLLPESCDGVPAVSAMLSPSQHHIIQSETTGATSSSSPDYRYEYNKDLPLFKEGEGDPRLYGDYLMSPIAKSEFVSTFAWTKMNESELFFHFC